MFKHRKKTTFQQKRRYGWNFWKTDGQYYAEGKMYYRQDLTMYVSMTDQAESQEQDRKIRHRIRRPKDQRNKYYWSFHTGIWIASLTFLIGLLFLIGFGFGKNAAGCGITVLVMFMIEFLTFAVVTNKVLKGYDEYLTNLRKEDQLSQEERLYDQRLEKDRQKGLLTAEVVMKNQPDILGTEALQRPAIVKTPSGYRYKAADLLDGMAGLPVTSIILKSPKEAAKIDTSRCLTTDEFNRQSTTADAEGQRFYDELTSNGNLSDRKYRQYAESEPLTEHLRRKLLSIEDRPIDQLSRKDVELRNNNPGFRSTAYYDYWNDDNYNDAIVMYPYHHALLGGTTGSGKTSTFVQGVVNTAVLHQELPSFHLNSKQDLKDFNAVFPQLVLSGYTVLNYDLTNDTTGMAYNPFERIGISMTNEVSLKKLQEKMESDENYTFDDYINDHPQTCRKFDHISLADFDTAYNFEYVKIHPKEQKQYYKVDLNNFMLDDYKVQRIRGNKDGKLIQNAEDLVNTIVETSNDADFRIAFNNALSEFNDFCHQTEDPTLQPFIYDKQQQFNLQTVPMIFAVRLAMKCYNNPKYRPKNDQPNYKLLSITKNYVEPHSYLDFAVGGRHFGQNVKPTIYIFHNLATTKPLTPSDVDTATTTFIRQTDKEIAAIEQLMMNGLTGKNNKADPFFDSQVAFILSMMFQIARAVMYKYGIDILPECYFNPYNVTVNFGEMSSTFIPDVDTDLGQAIIPYSASQFNDDGSLVNSPLVKIAALCKKYNVDAEIKVDPNSMKAETTGSNIQSSYKKNCNLFLSRQYISNFYTSDVHSGHYLTVPTYINTILASPTSDLRNQLANLQYLNLCSAEDTEIAVFGGKCNRISNHVIDEASENSFPMENLLKSLRQGRSAGIGTFFIYQDISDSISRYGEDTLLSGQLTNAVYKSCLGVKKPESIEQVSKMLGTYETYLRQNNQISGKEERPLFTAADLERSLKLGTQIIRLQLDHDYSSKVHILPYSTTKFAAENRDAAKKTMTFYGPIDVTINAADYRFDFYHLLFADDEDFLQQI